MALAELRTVWTVPGESTGSTTVRLESHASSETAAVGVTHKPVLGLSPDKSKEGAEGLRREFGCASLLDFCRFVLGPRLASGKSNVHEAPDKRQLVHTDDESEQSH